MAAFLSSFISAAAYAEGNGGILSLLGGGNNSDSSVGQMTAPPAQPSTQLPPLPAAATAAATPASSNFPVLPPSRPCTKRDIVGTWKLINVYEDPPGAETTSFSTYPSQFLLFDADTTFGRLNAGSQDLSAADVQNQVHSETSGLQQYLVQTSGIIYFYVDSKPTDSQACFIVATHVGDFLEGEMLLMPPEGQIQGRLVKQYSQITAPEKPVIKRKGKGRGKGNKRRGGRRRRNVDNGE